MPVRMSDQDTIYRRLRFGQLFELSMLDLRSYRSRQTSGTDVDNPARTLLGSAQLDWLRTGLAGATTRWKLVGNPVMISRLDVGTLPAWLLGPLATLLGIPANGIPVNADQWDGYNADRDRLVDHLRLTDTRDVLFLTGDIHTSWANELTTRATGTTPIAAEFVVPSVTSDNVDDILRLPSGIAGPVAAGLVRATNSHVRWTELEGHGYGVLEVRPDRCQMDWYHLTDRTRAASGVRWVQSWSVGTGSARIWRESARLPTAAAAARTRRRAAARA
jgi:alkaline phosphatase/alkaline phosphatase D